jgi:uncharacterized protein (TIGR03083 family)
VIEALTPVYTAALFPELHGELVALLRGLAPTDWERPTVAGRWRVRDVAAHLLDGDLRKVSVYRDGHALAPERPIADYRDLVAFINALNATGIDAARRLSPRVLVDLLEISGGWVSELVASLPPHEPSLFAVDWAGEARSENWMDTGREYTERWHHQMQIRDAVGAPGLLDRQWLVPLLDLSVRAIPRAYAGVSAAEGTAVVLEVTGGAAGRWSVVRDGTGWRVWRGGAPSPAATVRVDPDDAWRLLYNGLPAADARRRLEIVGDDRLALPLLAARSVLV